MNPATLLLQLARVPVWAWALAALLAWGGWQRHRANSARAEYQQAQATAQLEQAQSQAAAATESARRLKAHQEITDAEIQRRQAAEAAAAGLRTAEQRLRTQLAQSTARAASDPAPAGSGPPAPVSVLADVLGECTTAVRQLAREADATRAAGRACEASYDALTTPQSGTPR